MSPDDVLAVTFGTSDPAGYGVFTTPASSFPQRGTSYLVLSSGFVSSALLPNDHPNTSAELSGLLSPGGGNDMVQMQLTLRVPAGATTLSFRFKFLSEEYPEWVGTQYNDGFIVESGTSTFYVAGSSVIAPGNIVFDSDGNPITINTTGPLGMTAATASGTTYDGSTPVLRTTMPIPAGATTITLIFSVFDVGDNIYDSTVFLDELTFDTRPLELVALEVNQCIQDWHNSVGLVTDKITVVRAYLQSKDGQPVSARNVRLDGRRNGQSLPGSPLTALNSETFIAPAHTTDFNELSARRRSLKKSLNFRLPKDWRSGEAELRLVRDDGGVLDCAGNPSTNSDCRMSVTFSPVAELEVEFVRVKYKNLFVTYQPTVSDANELSFQLRAIYPISSLASRQSEYTYSGSSPNLAKLNAQLQKKRSDECVESPCKRLYYGILKDAFLNLSSVGGLANRAGGVASGYMSSPATALDYSRNRHAHEIGHLLGRPHAPYCGANAGSAPFPYSANIGGRTVATLGPLDVPPTAQGQAAEIWGLDNITSNTVADPRSQFELMSYCGFENKTWRWISKYTYEELKTSINGLYNLPAIAGSLAPAADAPYLFVRGTVDLDHNTAAFDYFETQTRGVAPPQPPTGDYELQLLDGSNNVLLQQEFSPIEMTADAPEGGSRMGVFIIPVHADDAIKRARVLHNGVILQEVTRSSNAPTMSLLSPNGGELLDGDLFTIRWSGADLDGDPILYSVQFSPDGGASWRTLAVDWPDQTYEVSISDLGRSAQGLVRVVASDGFNSASDVSDGNFTTRNTVPEALILSPGIDAKAYGGEPLHLEGLGVDREDGGLSGGSLTWSSDRDGPLGIGNDVILQARELSPGTHLITLTATDSDGQAATASVSVSVQPVAPPSTEPENAPPVAKAGSDILLECGGPAGTSVTLDASASTDSDADPLTYTWREGGNVIAGPTNDSRVNVVVGLGVHVIELMVEDGHGGTDTDELTVTIMDTVGPSLNVILTPTELWPPNHKLAAVHADVIVTDVCDANPVVQLISISSDEPDDGQGDGNFRNDVQQASLGTADYDFLLRSEREGNGDGRVYSVCYRSTDASGNSTTACNTVTVPHDQSGLASLAVADPDVNLVIFGTARAPVRTIVPGRVELGTDDFDRLAADHYGPSYDDRNNDGLEDAVFPFSGKAEQVRGFLRSGIGLYVHWWADQQSFLGYENANRIVAVPGEDLPVELAVSVWPNPVRGAASVRYALPQAGHVRLSIFDVSGREVGRLVDGEMSAGYHEARWSTRGRRAAAQVYLYRLDALDRTVTGRFVMLAETTQ